ncbi:kinase-like domain-containing protein [Helicostylum pulchrum]|nr:kinase-like domain-containing protein [Helicostylum pulchrum]
MFSRNNNHCQFVNKKEKKASTPLHIDTDPLGISFYEGDLKKGSAHAVVSPVSTPQQDTSSSMRSHHAISTSLSPFPSPSSSSSSVTTQLHEFKSLPSRTDISRSKCQINRPTQSLQSPPKLSAKSWENIKSPAASFLASFALSPVASSTERTVEVEREGDEIDDYVLDNIIGYGGFATVRKGYRASDGKKVAIKIIKKQYQSEEPDYRLERELSIWKLLDHPHIVCLQKVLETDTATFLICDYCPGGNLLDLLKKPMSENEARRIFLQLCQAVKYLHQDAKVCHKDLKLENILFDEDNNVKVCDFGLAIYQQPVKMNPATNLPLSPEIINELECAAGSLAYAAPEQIRSAKAISCPSTDIWSLGVVLYTLVTAKLPFHDDYDLRLQQKILNGQYDIPSNVSNELQQLIKSCLDVNPDTRFNINQVIDSSWCKL